MMEFERRKIIFDLNSLFKDYSYLLLLAEFSNNDYSVMIKLISKIIKYSFYNSVSDRLGFLGNTDKIDQDYLKYLEKNKERKSIFKKKNSLDFDYLLDSDIRINDIVGLELPSINTLKDTCRVNIQNKKEDDYRKNRRSEIYYEAMGFSETGLIYSTTDYVRFNSDTVYCHSSLTGDLNTDFNSLYNDERYGNKSTSPLNNNFSDNLDSILKHNDIDVTKFGNLYFIGNGRHRILYLMYYDCDIKIPVSVNKRIEDREFNLILLRLKDKYKMSFHKNNICNDNPDIIINYLDKTYNVKNTLELKRFEYLIDNGLSLDEFYISDYVKYYKSSDEKLFEHINNKVLCFYLNNKDSNIFEGNYSDYLKISGEVNSNMLFEAFTVNQKMYQKYKILKLDFDEFILSRVDINTSSDDNFNQKKK